VRLYGTIQDITDRKQAEGKLRENEEKYRLLHENAGIGIGYYKPDGTIISYNNLAAKNLNGKPEDFAGKSIFDIFPKPEAEFYLDRIKKSCLSDEPIVYEDKVSLPIGDKYFLSTFSKITDSSCQILGIQIISQDISNQKFSEVELMKTKSLLIEAERIANIGSWDWNLNTNVTFWSDQLFEIYGRKQEDGVPAIEHFLEQYHPNDRIMLQNAINQVISGEKEYNIDYRIYRYNDGIERLIQAKGEIIFDKNGQPERLIGVARDITEQKHTESELIRAKEKAEVSEVKYRLLYDSNQMPISIFDADSLKFLSVNNAMVQKYGYTKEEFLTMTILDIRPESETGKVKQLVSTIDEGLVNAGIFLHKKKNGEIIQVEIIRCEIDFEGKRAKLVFAHDVSDATISHKSSQRKRAQSDPNK